MYYDDQARRFTLMSGLAFGAVLGAGVALLLPPLRMRRTPLEKAGLRKAGSWAQLAVSRARDQAPDSWADAVRRGASRTGR
ncbi:MAG: hypothetical protein M3409_01580 [Gemmatimonadota bacterium]|nr:hypothetical protein [Gemmatimonadota bacterium]